MPEAHIPGREKTIAGRSDTWSLQRRNSVEGRAGIGIDREEPQAREACMVSIPRKHPRSLDFRCQAGEEVGTGRVCSNLTMSVPGHALRSGPGTSVTSLSR